MVIVDAGHGGMINGVYQDLAAKRTPPDPKEYTFTNAGFTAYEGVINRKIASRLEQKLEKVFSLTTHFQEDMSLTERIKRANAVVKDGWILVSIHCDKLTKEIKGTGNRAKGGHVIIAPPNLAGQPNKHYQTSRNIAEKITAVMGFKRQISERSDISMVKGVNCPSVLVECGFYDNLEEVKYLMSEQGIEEIADKLAQAFKN